MHDEVQRRIGDNIARAQRIMVVSHIRPDGDAIGSLLGLGLALQEAGKQVELISVDGVPATFKHLSGCELITRAPVGEFDLSIVVDSSDLPRVGGALDQYGLPDINIDHHVTNLNFAKINYVDPGAVATTEILAESLPLWNLPISGAVAEALLTGLITDTLGFRTSNMSPAALRVAARLVELGANLPELYRLALGRRSFEATKFWGSGISKLERDGELVWATLTMEDRKAVGYPGRDDADLINVLAGIDSAVIVMIFVEQPNGHVKVSWRSQPGYDVSGIALRFGGGGHPAASGADIEGTLTEVQQRVINETNLLIRGELVGHPQG